MLEVLENYTLNVRNCDESACFWQGAKSVEIYLRIYVMTAHIFIQHPSSWSLLDALTTRTVPPNSGNVSFCIKHSSRGFYIQETSVEVVFTPIFLQITPIFMVFPQYTPLSPYRAVVSGNHRAN